MFETIDRVLLMSDLDGTLLPADKVLRKEDCEAIAAFRHAGGKFAFATGRTLQSVPPYLAQLQVDQPVILYNGGCIYDPVADRILYLSPLSSRAREITAAILQQYPGVGAEVLRPDGTYVIRRNAYEDDHIQVCGVEPIFCALEAVPEGEWLKVLFATSADVVDAMAQDAAWKSYPEVSFVRSSDHFYEMLPAGVTKGSALAVYRQMLYPDGITTVAVGDYQNDLEMIVAADFGAVPSNGQACVKAAADYVLERSCDSGAVAELIAVINSKISKTEVLPWM